MNELAANKFTKHVLDDQHHLFTGMVPDDVRFDQAGFDEMWIKHPDEYETIIIMGEPVKLPRWQQNYGMNYRYAGVENRSQPIPEILQSVHDWCRAEVDDRLNGILVNWYDGSIGHYIGKHRDSTQNMCDGGPIVTVSLGEERLFRLRPWKAKGKVDFPVPDGSVIVLPYATNQAWTHEVPKAAKYKGRRISITLRAFNI